MGVIGTAGGMTRPRMESRQGISRYDEVLYRVNKVSLDAPCGAHVSWARFRVAVIATTKPRHYVLETCTSRPRYPYRDGHPKRSSTTPKTGHLISVQSLVCSIYRSRWFCNGMDSRGFALNGQTCSIIRHAEILTTSFRRLICFFSMHIR